MKALIVALKHAEYKEDLVFYASFFGLMAVAVCFSTLLVNLAL